MRTVLVSDLHLGSGGGIDLLRRDDIREPLWRELERADEVVLLGDVVELRERPLDAAMELARPVLRELLDVAGDARIVVVPGNHDHYLVDRWLERRRLDGAEPLGLAEQAVLEEGPVADVAKQSGRTLELAYPGLWVRPRVYATHGHYMDRHLTIPTFERLAVAAVERMLQRDPAEEPELDADLDSAAPEDYERAQAPVYAFLFALAQAGGLTDRVGSPSARVWQTLGGGYGRAARVRGWLLGTVAVPGAVRVANRLGLGPVRSDLSPGAITRAGIAAITEVKRRLGVDADHLIFGHTHRRGPMGDEAGWILPEGTRLWNTGSWVYSPGLLGRTAADSPYWPGTIVVVEDDRAPSPRHLLEDRGKQDLRG